MSDVDDWWEPDCGGCGDSGIAQPRRWWESPRVFARRRAGRDRCTCNPSPRQERRIAYRARRDAERWQRDVAAGRVTPGAFDDAPF